MKKILFLLFAVAGIFTLNSCGSLGVEIIDPYYSGGYYNPYGAVYPYRTVYYPNAPVVTDYYNRLPPPPAPIYHR